MLTSMKGSDFLLRLIPRDLKRSLTSSGLLLLLPSGTISRGSVDEPHMLIEGLGDAARAFGSVGCSCEVDNVVMGGSEDGPPGNGRFVACPDGAVAADPVERSAVYGFWAIMFASAAASTDGVLLAVGNDGGQVAERFCAPIPASRAAASSDEVLAVGTTGGQVLERLCCSAILARIIPEISAPALVPPPLLLLPLPPPTRVLCGGSMNGCCVGATPLPPPARDDAVDRPSELPHRAGGGLCADATG